MKNPTKRVFAMLLALALCLTLLPMAAMAEEDDDTITITFKSNYAGGGTCDTISIPAGGSIPSGSLPTPRRDGYIFRAWYYYWDDLNSSADVDDPDSRQSLQRYNYDDTTYPSDATLYAEWVKIHTITFDPNGGTVSPTSAQTNVDQQLDIALPTPKREGYTFLGWFTRDSYQAGDHETWGGDGVLTAKWEQDGAAQPEPGMVITFDPNGGTCDVKTLPLVNWTLTEPLPVPTWPGYTFEGWYNGYQSPDNPGYKIKEGDSFTAPPTVTAVWSENKANPDGPFTVTFFLNNGTGTTPKPQTVEKGDTVDLPDAKNLTPPRSNYTFGAWAYLANDGNLYAWPEERPVTSDLTLFAGWVLKGKVVVNGEAIDSQPAEATKPAETAKPAETEKPAAPAFTDVAAASPFAPAISWAVEKKITNGTGDGTTFSPGNPCTRAQIVTFLWRAAGSPEPKAAETQYMDVTNKDAYYYKAIQWAAEMDMEYSGTFDPHDPCTRAAAVYFIWKANGSPKADSKASFTDLPEEPADGSQWYWPDLLDAVDWAVNQGVTNGTGDGTTFSPDNPCTRGQIVTFLYRVYEK